MHPFANPLPSPREGIISPDRRRAAPARHFALISCRIVRSTAPPRCWPAATTQAVRPAPRAAPPPATCPPANGAASAPTPVPTAHDQRYAEAPPAQHTRPLVDEQGGTQAQPRALAPTSNPRLTRTAERFGARTHVVRGAGAGCAGGRIRYLRGRPGHASSRCRSGRCRLAWRRERAAAPARRPGRGRWR